MFFTVRSKCICHTHFCSPGGRLWSLQNHCQQQLAALYTDTSRLAFFLSIRFTKKWAKVLLKSTFLLAKKVTWSLHSKMEARRRENDYLAKRGIPKWTQKWPQKWSPAGRPSERKHKGNNWFWLISGNLGVPFRDPFRGHFWVTSGVMPFEKINSKWEIWGAGCKGNGLRPPIIGHRFTKKVQKKYF